MRALAATIVLACGCTFATSDLARVDRRDRGWRRRAHLCPDTLRVRTSDEKLYTATIAHDPIDWRVPIGTVDALLVDVAHGDVVLANVDDPTDTITMTVDVTGAIGGIPRP